MSLFENALCYIESSYFASPLSLLEITLMSILSQMPKGKALLDDTRLNKGTAFTLVERKLLGLEGLLPPQTFDLTSQVNRVLHQLDELHSDLERYNLLTALAKRNQTVFYRLLVDHIDTIMPLIYTPTVGLACQKFGRIYQYQQGVYLSLQHKGRLQAILKTAAPQAIKVIVVTDGERILGLGDLGTYGMGIPVGKLALYSACGGIDPQACLPVVLDTGTNNPDLIADPWYTGLKQDRVRGQAYDDFLDEFIAAVQTCYPDVLVQFEDFANRNAFRLLARYQPKACVFNDDIQGTGAVALAGIYAALRISKQALVDQRFLFLGAGEAAQGIAQNIVTALQAMGMGLETARQHCWFVDSRGLIQSQRTDLNAHKQQYAHDHAAIEDLTTAVATLKPTALIGVSGQAGRFSADIIAKMAEFNQCPIIFALSNPTSKAECSATAAYQHSQGRAIFASGSPFAPVSYEGQTFHPGQGNNAYIFPGVGLAISYCRIHIVTDELFFIAAKTLADCVSQQDLDEGRIYPPLSQIRQVSLTIAVAVADYAYAQNLAALPKPNDLKADMLAHMYDPVYSDYISE